MSLVRYLTAARRLAHTGPEGDATLLDRFVDSRDPEAFAELVRRHGPMVLGVCRRKLGDSHAADDAFQAVFLVLSRKAASVRPREAVGNWLFGVAVRVAAHAKGRVARARARESRVTDMSTIPDRASPDHTDPELLAQLDVAIAALPDKYRSAVVLCDLEGRTLQQAAEMLEVPLGTVASRLARGREMLATRLRKLVPAASVGGVATICSGAIAATPARLFDLTVASAFNMTLVSQSVQDLTQGVIRHMFLTKLRALATLGGALFTLAGAAALAVAVPDKPAIQPAKPVPAYTGNVADAGKQVATANTQFAFDLYRKLIAEKEQTGKNVFVSPFSVSSALAMTAVGASGKGFEEMRSVLHLPKDESLTDAGFKHLFAAVNDRDTSAEKRGYKLAVANALWVQKGDQWSKEFIGRVNGRYGAGVFGADFASNPQAERLRINAWVEDNTEKKIKELLQEGDVEKSTEMVVTNAVSFKGSWVTAFDPERSAVRPFRLLDRSAAKVPMMAGDGKYAMVAGKDFEALELPYKGGVSMVVFLPKKEDGLAAVEQSLTPEVFSKTVADLRAATPEKMSVIMPKFKFEVGYKLLESGAGVLPELGMKSVCKPGHLNRLTDSPNRIVVSNVIHKTFVDVNEEGTEAVGATAGRAANAEERLQFRADRPFVFAIVHHASNTVLFLGRVTNPGAN